MSQFDCAECGGAGEHGPMCSQHPSRQRVPFVPVEMQQSAADMRTDKARIEALEQQLRETLGWLRAVLPAAEAEMVTLPYVGNSQIHESINAVRAALDAQDAAGEYVELTISLRDRVITLTRESADLRRENEALREALTFIGTGQAQEAAHYANVTLAAHDAAKPGGAT